MYGTGQVSKSELGPIPGDSGWSPGIQITYLFKPFVRRPNRPLGLSSETCNYRNCARSLFEKSGRKVALVTSCCGLHLGVYDTASAKTGPRSHSGKGADFSPDSCC
ncbi:hypothetical protein Zmor_019276 [Zophobas morio]|uniref:Uncharacterized protein n=1 Tax=Zophobas morio TaxID=2755281 RepID=A0AA38I449_9CUCU|nr:hypothetical protein Zmor_019276 [Zophobas morio]